MFSLKEARDSQSRFSVKRCHIDFSGVIDTSETVSAASMTPLKPKFFLPNFSGVIETAETLDLILIAVSAVSTTPLKQFQRCQ
jgi:hypothetical protein